MTLIKSRGVNFYKIHFNGDRNEYEFIVYSPKLRAVKELLPYMSPEKVKNHLQGRYRIKMGLIICLKRMKMILQSG